MDKKKAVQVQVGLSVKSTKQTKNNQNSKPKPGAQELANQSARKVCLLIMLILGSHSTRVQVHQQKKRARDINEEVGPGRKAV